MVFWHYSVGRQIQSELTTAPIAKLISVHYSTVIEEYGTESDLVMLIPEKKAVRPFHVVEVNKEGRWSDI